VLQVVTRAHQDRHLGTAFPRIADEFSDVRRFSGVVSADERM